MKILVANLGSTSFKYRLFDMGDERQLARGGIERIGQGADGRCMVEIGEYTGTTTRRIDNHAEAVRMCLEQLTNHEWGCLDDVEEVSAIGFKAVFAGNLSGVRFVDDELLEAMEDLSDVAPAHNPPYARAMRELQRAFPEMPLVAALETGFHDAIPDEQRTYAVPLEWRDDFDIKRWGFHGASHQYIAVRTAELLERDDLRIISCHLGGSSSLCAIHNGKSVANSLGMSPQSGLPHNNRVGDFDPFALPILMRATGKSLEELLDDLANRSGLLGVSGLSGDVRDLEQAASEGNKRADLALNVFIASIRHYLGAYLAVLGGADAVVFTGGIGENGQSIRRGVCAGMQWAGIELDENRNTSATGETQISTDDGTIEIWTIPTNEELIVARQTAAIVKSEIRNPKFETNHNPE